jgi:energy-coupling factor transporter ATP-binding protein EcfA2
MTLELRDVTYRYPGASRPAIQGVDLAIAAGEIVGVVGPNDAGKSTLCLVASGLAPASIGGTLTGEVAVGDASLNGRAPHELADLTGIVMADPSLQRSGIVATVFEEVALGPVNLGWSRAVTIDAVRAALRAVGIDHLAERHPERLSGGQWQLLSIASSISTRPRALVLDEPTAQLDPEATDLVVDALRSIARGGAAILIAEHRLDVLDALGARRVTLADGRVAAEVVA